MDRLNNGDYATAEQCSRDLRLIFENCRKYFPPRHEITVMCGKVENVFAEKIKKVRSDYFSGIFKVLSLAKYFSLCF